jgi:peroxiredoxin Q/BCP
MIGPGAHAPAFELPDQDGETVSLGALRGRTIVLYFYPKADTPGCTTQACSIRDRGPDYSAAGVRVIGISPDPVAKVDADHAVCELYGVWVEKSMYGRKYWGAQRATFIIDPRGTIVHVIPKASPKTHDDEVLKALSELAPAAS